MRSAAYFQMVSQEGMCVFMEKEMEWVRQSKRNTGTHCTFLSTFLWVSKGFETEKGINLKNLLKTY